MLKNINNRRFLWTTKLERKICLAPLFSCYMPIMQSIIKSPSLQSIKVATSPVSVVSWWAWQSYARRWFSKCVCRRISAPLNNGRAHSTRADCKIESKLCVRFWSPWNCTLLQRWMNIPAVSLPINKQDNI